MIKAADIRKALRFSHKELDAEIKRTMKACLLDMERVGIRNTEDELTDRAIDLYCKGAFDFQGKGQQYMQSYEKLRDAMSSCEKYRKGASDV